MRGDARLCDHPGIGGVNAEFDRPSAWIDNMRACLAPEPAVYSARFLCFSGARAAFVAWSPLSQCVSVDGPSPANALARIQSEC